MNRWTKADIVAWGLALLSFALFLSANAIWAIYRHEPLPHGMLQVTSIALMVTALIMIIWCSAFGEPAPEGYQRHFEAGDVLFWIAFLTGIALTIGPLLSFTRDLVPAEFKAPGMFLVFAAGIWSIRKHPPRFKEEKR
jgi:phosphatidylglycerophosphate synthase